MSSLRSTNPYLDKQWYAYSFWPWRLKPQLSVWPLRWKDKYDSPRCEAPPHVEFRWLWFVIGWIKGSDNFWEQWLWVHKYNDGDIEKAEETWGWVDHDTKKSTWKHYE